MPHLKRTLILAVFLSLIVPWRSHAASKTFSTLRLGVGIPIGDLPLDLISGPSPAQWRFNAALVAAADVRLISFLGARGYLGFTIPPKNSTESAMVVYGVDGEFYLLQLGTPTVFELAFIGGLSNLLNTPSGNHYFRAHLGARMNLYLGPSFFVSSILRTNLTYMHIEGGIGFIM